MWLELDIDSYERSMCARHACRLWSRLIQATPAALTICIATMRDRLFRCLGYAQDCHAKTAAWRFGTPQGRPLNEGNPYEHYTLAILRVSPILEISVAVKYAPFSMTRTPSGPLANPG
jgi:hypothetical protein